MRHFAIVAALTLGCSMLGGCPIPVRRRVLVRLAGSIQVVEAGTRQPVGGATVTVRRYRRGPSPAREDHRETFTTNAAGMITLSRLIDHDWIYPLWMHGVNWTAFDVCARAQGYEAQPHEWVAQDNMYLAQTDLATQPTLVVEVVKHGPVCEDDRRWSVRIWPEQRKPR